MRLKAIIAFIVAGVLFLAAAFMLYDPAPPAGMTADYVAESSQSSQADIEESSVEESQQSVRVLELVEEDESVASEENEDNDATEEDEVKTGMAILQPSPEQMIYLSKTLPYTEDELVYWNNLALEYGITPFDGTGDFYTFTQAVQQAIDQALAAQEPVYEEPVYEEPVYEEPVYEEPVSETPVEEVPVDEDPGSFDENDVYPYNGSSDNTGQ